ncbi:hypothetical protein HDU98_007711 [Podochytrium sp. JEL0797]|nr:hypothetical protein HDU98_007711 [Podochytrium sp. JEL0797]
MSHPHFTLSAQLEGHSQDVRALAPIPGSESLFSSSRDTKVLRWTRDASTNPAFALTSTYTGHSHFVNSLLYIKPTPEFPEGLIASGSADKSINVFDPRNDTEPVFTLLGHTDNISALTFDEATGGIISGSWDKTVKLWINWECVLTLTGHSQAVWAVLSAGGNGILTASADKTIKFWKDGNCVHTLSGHTDAVRALAPLEGVGFASASNDGTIRIWNFNGDCLSQLYGHTSFVYGLTALPGGGFASCGEDRTVRVWQVDGNEYKCVQTIQHPCTSVWCVSALSNGDIVSGGSDAIVRVFTTSDERVATAEQTKEFDEALAKQQIPSNQVGDVDKTKLPGLEALAQPGNPDQVIMVRNNDLVEAHQFNASEGQWVKIGEVVDAVGGGRKQMYCGREYDYVFDIDIGAGQNLKLPYDNSENPYMAAQRFIDTHELDQDFLEQIALFVINNSKPTTIGPDVNANQFIDPFTGAGRYVPGSAPSGSGVGVDPFTGAGRYVPGSVAPSAAPVAVNLFPGTYTTFGAINCKGVKTKIAQLNSDAEKIEGRVLSTDELSTLNALLDLIELGKDTVSNSLNERYWGPVSKVAFEWPEAVRFPGIDLIRICALYSPAPIALSGTDFLPKLMHAAGLATPFTAVGSETNKMLCMRTIANLVGTAEGYEYVYKNRQTIVDILGYKWSLSLNANLRLAVASVFLNLIIVLKQKKDDSFSFDLLAHLMEFLSSESDVENELRILVALGTLLKDNKAAQEAAGLVDIKSVLKASRNKGVDKILQAHRAVLKK